MRRWGCAPPLGRRRQVEVREVEALVLTAQEWQRLSLRDGTKGPRLFDWARVPLLHQWEDDASHWLLIRRSISDSKQKTYYLVFAQPATPLEAMVKAMGARWHIEEDFETGKDTGLDHYQVRSFIGWYRHITLVMLAQAFLQVICAQTQQASAPDSPPMPDSVPALPLTIPAQAPLTVPEVRHLLGHLIWPSACHAGLVLAWSSWRRWHRSLASYYHTKRRLEAG
jgi:hypothetical protein